MASPAIPSVGRSALLALVGAVAALAIVLMHGGVAHAAACAGGDSGLKMSTMGMSTMGMSTMGMSTQPTPDQPAHVHGPDMCLSTASSAALDTAQHATTAMAETPAHAISNAVASGPVVPATGREPPVPDLLTALCVSRR